MKISTLLVFGLVFSAVYSLYSCQKNTDCIAEVTIVDTSGNHLSGASVSLQYNILATPPQTNTVTIEVTNQSGVATFSFKEPAIYDVDVTYKGKRDTLGIIKLVQGSTVSQTYTFK